MAVRLPLGLLYDCAQMRAAMAEQGFPQDQVRASELAADPRLPGRLIGPVRDAAGQLVTFWALDLGAGRPKLLFHRAWRHRVPVVGLDVAAQAANKGQSPLVLVEDILDALLLHSLGFACAAAIAGSFAEMTEARWQSLAEIGIGSVVLLVPPAPRIDGALERSLDLAYQAKPAPEVHVLFPGKKGPRRSLNEWLQRCGVEALEAAIRRRALPGYTAKARFLLARHRPADGWTDEARRAAWAEAVRFYQARIPFGVESLERWFVPPVETELGIAWDIARFRSAAAVPAAAQPPPKRTAAQPSGSRSDAGREPASAQALAQDLGPAAEQNPPAPRRAASLGYCPLHRCDPLACFCFD